MLNFRFHPEAKEELLESARYIKNDDPEQGEPRRLAMFFLRKAGRILPLATDEEGETSEAKKGSGGRFGNSANEILHLFRVRRISTSPP